MSDNNYAKIMITIRQVQIKRDLPAILKIEQAIFGVDAYGISEFLYQYMVGRETFLVAYHNETFVGYICAHAEEHHAYIASIAVDTYRRRQGIAQQFLLRVIQHFTAIRLVQAIDLHVRQSNQGAIALYKAQGFEIIGTEIDYYPNEDAHVMRLSLKS